jgi:hypothetical protein
MRRFLLGWNPQGFGAGSSGKVVGLPMSKRTLLIGGRLIFGLLTLTAIITQLVIHIQHRFDVVNFFSYFTNLSNILASVVFLVGAVYLLQRREPTPTDDLIRGATVVAMAIVGIVYGILLRNEDLGTLLPWVNIVVHFIMPVAVVADWLILPPKSTITTWQMAYWLVYPLAFVVYTLVRGPAADFYPYPFLNPDKAGGYGGVALYCLAILLAFLLVGGLLRFLGNRLTGTV